MAWRLPTNYTDAVWTGLKRYLPIENEDGTVSFQDVTEYSHLDTSFFGAKDANAMNEAMNAIMASLENGTDLYTAFQEYFAEQKTLFENEMNEMEDDHEALFKAWFNSLVVQLDANVAGNLQNQINELDIKTDGFKPRNTVFSNGGKNITETYGTKRVETEFVSDNVIVQKCYIGDVLAFTKTVTISEDGVKEDIK